MSEAFLGELRIFGFNFPPLNWTFADGALLPISQNSALFSLLGTQFGGNGINIFQLPNCVSNVIVGAGQSTTGTQYDVGEQAGEATVPLLPVHTPAHTHSFNAANPRLDADTNKPGAKNSFATADGCKPYLPAGSGSNVAMAPLALTPAFTNGGQPHENRMPTLVLNYCICLNGIFPPRP